MKGQFSQHWIIPSIAGINFCLSSSSPLSSSSAAPCLYHHRVREGFFKLDQIPAEVVANVFKYIPTLDIGRMMVVCKGFNQILSTNPSLWRIVDLDKSTPNESAFKIIKNFAARSRDTLVAIKTPEDMDGSLAELGLLMKRSKATLRRLDLKFFDNEVYEAGRPSLSFFNSFPNIERLNLTSKDLPEAGEQIPGVLTMFAYEHFFMDGTWSPEDLDRFISVSFLHVTDHDSLEENGCLHPALQACSPNLLHLSIGPVYETPPFQFDLPKLSSLLFIGPYDDSRRLFTRPLPSLKHLEGPPVQLDGFNVDRLQSVNFRIESDNWGGERDLRLNSVEKMIKLVKDSKSSTLRSIKLKAGEEGEFGIDPFLRTLKVDYSSQLFPLLSDLLISKEQEFNLQLLAEVMVSRNFAAKGWKFEGEVGDVEDRRCSRLVLHLDFSHIKDFKKSEKEVLSRCPSWTAKRACRTEIEEWDGV